MTVRCEWQEIYSDDGYWFSGSYDTVSARTQDSSRANFHPYYAILRKSWEHSLVLAINDTLAGKIILEAGSSFKDISDYEYKNHQYSLSQLKIGYVIIPFLALNTALNEHFTIKLLVKRYIDTIADDYWNLSFIFSADF
jgi:predicted glutamine amidotransferase